MADWAGRGHGQTDFHLTQLLTGHGDFEAYLHRFAIRDSPTCRACLEEEDTAGHTFFDCPARGRSRAELERAVGAALSPETLVKIMLTSPGHWEAVARWARETLEGKD